MLKQTHRWLTGLVILALVLSGCTAVMPQTGAPRAETGSQKLEIYHWWTAPGEREAADAMFAALHAAYPDIQVMENPSPGGGGVNQRVVLQSRIAAGDYPDTFQTLGGAELKNYVDSGVLEPLDDLWAELDYAAVIPGPLAKAVSVDGHPYVVPLNMHIQNILYYNLPLFEELGIEPPTDFAELLTVAETIQAAKPGMAPLALGSKEKWGDAFVFDSILLEAGGPEYYVQFHKGEIDVTADPIYREALEKFEQLIPYINMDHSALTWDQAVGLVGAEQAAMTLMGTWAIGAFTQGSNWEPGVDFGAVTFPQKPERILLFHPDTYGMTVKAPNPEATMDWLRVVASPELQIPTDITQGGLFARTDIDPTEFPDPIRQELQTYVRDHPDKLILDQHGSILPATAQPIYWDIMATFLAQPDVDKTIQAVADMFTTYGVKEASAWYVWP
ncbi:MAG: extracellular solute-binding protein [Caldilineaceae bacterium]|nr:extracellular solute-binding protein [Caldilineaceae bacterium]